MTQEFVTLPRETVEQALKALQNVREQLGSTVSEFNAIEAIRAALEQPQPKREPLTDEEIDKLCPQFDDPMRREMWIIGFKAAHNIK